MKGTVYTLHAHDVRQQVARGGRVRRFPVLGRLALCLFFAFAVICQPYTLAFEGWQIRAQKQEAQAVPVAIPAALAYLEAMAAAAGLSVGDFMLTVGIGVASITGFNMLDEAAQYGASGTVNGLYKLVSTAEWPEWSTLDAATQESWGSESNYTAAQFNAGLSALGLAESRDAYYSSGGGDLDEGSTSLAQRIGQLANTWMTGGITALSDVYALVSDPTNLIQGVMSDTYGVQAIKKLDINGHEIRFAYIPVYRTWSNGPSSNPPVVLTPENWYACNLSDVVYSGNIYRNLWYMPTGANLAGIAIDYDDEKVTARGYNIKSAVTVWSEKPVADRWGQLAGVISASAVTLASTIDGVNYRVGYYDNPNWYFNSAYGGVYYDTHNAAYDISEIPYDYGQMPGTEGDMVNGLDYPEDNVGATNLSPDKDWKSLFSDGTPPPTPPEPTPDPGYPESDFNPDVGDDGGDYVPETSTPEWQKKTQDQIFKPVLNLPFDRMFPFCVIWDISLLMDKLYELGGYQAVSADQSTSLRSLYAERDGLQVQADEASKGGTRGLDGNKPAWTAGHTEIALPLRSFAVDGMEQLDIDVWPLAVLLQWLKPFFQLAFVAGLLFVTIVTFRTFIFSD